jgi:hypothetical protein
MDVEEEDGDNQVLYVGARNAEEGEGVLDDSFDVEMSELRSSISTGQKEEGETEREESGEGGAGGRKWRR